MGQKNDSNLMRLGIVRDWSSHWYSPYDKNRKVWLIQDLKITNYFEKKERLWGLSDIEIDRSIGKLKIVIHTARPGSVYGQEGVTIKKIEKDIAMIVKDKSTKTSIAVEEVSKPDLDAKIIANEIATALENRVSFRIAQKRVIRRVMRSGAKGIKTLISGRLNGVDMARSEGYSEGVVPLQTFRNNIDYALAEAHTTYGVLGVKVWISRGEVLDRKERDNMNKRETREPRETRPWAPRPESNKKFVSENSQTRENNKEK